MNNNRISLNKFRELLKPGVVFTAEFIGKNAHHAPEGTVITKREVSKNSPHQMISNMLDGPKAGHMIYLQWTGKAVEQLEEGSYIVIHKENNEHFLKITMEPSV